MKVLIAAGGSGGHIFPAVALAKALTEKREDVKIRFVGSNKDLDRRIFEKEGFKAHFLSANKLPYRPSIRMVGFVFNLFLDFIRTFCIIIIYRPNVVVGFGGYVSFPTIYVAHFLRIATVVHEQNVAPGRANNMLFRVANTVAISFRQTEKYLEECACKAAFTGNPIRTDELKDDKADGLKKFGLKKGKFTILVIGGSQGAHILNETFIKALGKLKESIKPSLQVIHITGLKDYDWAVGEYSGLGIENRVHSFIDRIEEAYSASDMVITRSGASAIFEIAFYGRPMILVPYPFAMSHQIENAREFAKMGAAVEIDEDILSPDLLKDNIELLLNDKSRLKNLADSARKISVPAAAGNLANEVLNWGSY